MPKTPEQQALPFSGFKKVRAGAGNMETSNQERVNRINRLIEEMLSDPEDLSHRYNLIKRKLGDEDKLSAKKFAEEIVRPIFLEVGINLDEVSEKEYEFRYKEVNIEKIALAIRKLKNIEMDSGQGCKPAVNVDASQERKPWSHAEASVKENNELDPPRGVDPSKGRKI